FRQLCAKASCGGLGDSRPPNPLGFIALLPRPKSLQNRRNSGFPRYFFASRSLRSWHECEKSPRRSRFQTQTLVISTQLPEEPGKSMMLGDFRHESTTLVYSHCGSLDFCAELSPTQ